MRGLTITAANGINDRGQIVGTAKDAVGNDDAVILTVVGSKALFASKTTQGCVQKPVNDVIQVEVDGKGAQARDFFAEWMRLVPRFDLSRS